MEISGEPCRGGRGQRGFEGIEEGWFLGGEEFLERLEGVVKGALGEKKRESFEGEAVSRHG